MSKKNNPAAKNEKAVVISPNPIATEPVSNGSVAQNVNSDLTLSPILTPAVDQEKANENTAETANTGAAEQNVNPDLMLSQDEIFLDNALEKPIGIPGLEVQSKQAGFRRAGRAWSTEPTFVALDDLTEEQFLALEAEPMLIVKRIYG
jgi:hypothetical protein